MNIRGLVVDDTAGNATAIKETFTIEFSTFNWQVQWTLCKDALDARTTVLKTEAFDFAVVDLDLGEDRQNGYAVVKELHDKDERTFVLVVTRYPDRFPEFREKAEKAGAHVAILLGQLSDEPDKEWSFANVAERFRKHLRSSSHAAETGMTYAESDPGILSILQNIGADQGEDSTKRGLHTVYALALRCLDGHFTEDAGATLSYLTPGRSGAYVCRIDVSRPHHPTESFVLKLGLDPHALKQELKANREAARVLTQQTLMHLMGELQFDPRSGYGAIVGKLADEAVPLGGWLTDSATADQARSVARIIFGEQLHRLFAPELHHEVPLSRWLSSPHLLKLRLHTDLSARRYALADSRAGNCANADELLGILTHFVDTGSMPVANPDRLSGDTKYVKAFGDLHSANLLVQTGINARSVLIDATQYGNHHWSADSSRLLVDLFLRRWRPGIASILWDDFAESSQIAARLCPACEDPGLPDDQTVVGVFVNEVLTNLPTFLQFVTLGVTKSVWHWQWHVALAKEFLRQAFHVDVSPPRSTLALQAAANHIRVGARLVDEIQF